MESVEGNFPVFEVVQRKHLIFNRHHTFIDAALFGKLSLNKTTYYGVCFSQSDVLCIIQSAVPYGMAWHGMAWYGIFIFH